MWRLRCWRLRYWFGRGLNRWFRTAGERQCHPVPRRPLGEIVTRTTATGLEHQPGQVAVGINTLKQVKEKADELGINMPLASSLYQIIYNKAGIDHIIVSLMLEETELDVEFVGKAKLLAK